jgi:hypothetical protein
MVCDFVKDDSGLWWFIGCRSFIVSGNNGKPHIRYFNPDAAAIALPGKPEDEDECVRVDVSKGKSDYTKLKMCRFCQVGYPLSDLCH